MIDEKLDEEFEEMRAEAHRWMCETNKILIENWCKEAHYTRPVGYYNDLNGTMTIYAEHPGYLIGRAGVFVDKFEEQLKNTFHREYKVEFIQISGEFVNINTK